jgi:hypothetical protein
MEHKLLTKSPMSAKSDNNENHRHVTVRSIDLDAPMLVDQIGAELLDHLIVCRRCLLVFMAQDRSIREAGCVKGMRVVSQSNVRWQERRSNLAHRHLTEQTLDDYLFDRFTLDELHAIKHHISCCSQCAQELRQRETLATLIKAAFSDRQAGMQTSSNANGVMRVQVSPLGFSACFKKKLGNDHT